EEEFGKHDKQLAIVKHALDGGDNVPGSSLQVAVTWSIFMKQLLLYNRMQARAAYRIRIDARRNKSEADRHRAVATKAAEDKQAADENWQVLERQTRKSLRDYFDEFGVVSHVGSESELLREVKPWADSLIDDIESNELRRYERQARQAAEKAATLLRG